MKPVKIQIKKQFQINGDYIELNKLLKACGWCATGGHAKITIKDKLVTVDGEIETRIRRKIRDGMTVEFNLQSQQVKRISIVE